MRRPTKWMHPLEAMKVLGISTENELTGDTVKIAYRRLAIKHHPDKGGDAVVFKKIAFAYESLSHNLSHARTFVGKKVPEKQRTKKNVATINWQEIFSKGGRVAYTAYQSTGTETNTDNSNHGFGI